MAACHQNLVRSGCAWPARFPAASSRLGHAFFEQTLALASVDPLTAQLDHFCDVTAGRAAPIISVADALQSLRNVQAVRRSIATGKIRGPWCYRTCADP
jgi:predicted dehydrogenase